MTIKSRRIFQDQFDELFHSAVPCDQKVYRLCKVRAMSLKYTEQEYQAILKNQAVNCAVATKPAKFRNQRCEYNGRKFDSKRERDKYIQLEQQKAAKLIRGFTCQVSLPLASGKRRMRIDFMVVETDGRIRWLDSKGYADDTWLVKRDELEHHLGIKIECV